MDESLRNAALQGNIDALYASIAGDPYVLDRIDEIPFVETPLHTAAFEGHTEFAREIMRLKPSFAKKLNQNGFTPVHRALQNNQTQLVLNLLEVEKDLVRVPRKEGVTPLHYLAETGNLDILAKFLRICPNSIEDVTIRGETVLHIALKYNMFDAFRFLVGWLRQASFKSDSFSEMKLFDWQDVEGNTVLHIAVTTNQPQASSRFLLKENKVGTMELWRSILLYQEVTIVKTLLDGNWFFRVDVNAKNLGGFTALDISQRQTQIDNSEKIKNMLRRAGALSARSLRPVRSHEAFFKSPVPFVTKLFILRFRQQMNMTTKERNMFLVVVVLFLTSTFQAGTISPSGGVSQDNYNASSTDQFKSTIPFNSTVLPINVTREHSPFPQTDYSISPIIFTLFNFLCFFESAFIVAFLLPFGFVSALCFSPMILFCMIYMGQFLNLFRTG